MSKIILGFVRRQQQPKPPEEHQPESLENAEKSFRNDYLPQ